MPLPARLTAPLVRTVSAVALAGLTVVAGAASADAHVTVGADDAHQGATDSVLTFRVPDEEATATTVKVTIAFPQDTPLPSVKPAPKPGWTVATAKVTFNPPITTDDGTITDGVSKVVYTAMTPSAAIPVGGFDTFQILVGPLPAKASSLAFPTLQTYSDGKTASWVQPITDPANEPDNPAPTLRLLAATAPGEPVAGSAAAGSASAGSQAAPSTDAGSASYATASEVTSVRTLSVAALVLAVLGMVVGATGSVLALRRRGPARQD